MNPEERAYMEQQQRETQLAQASLQQNQINQMNQSLIAQEQERSMVKDQLDLNEELETIHNLLRGNIKIKDDNGTRWVAPTDSEMIILSNYGIHLIMNTITFYINKNTLLSNYDEQTILGKMEDFSTDLTDTIFIEYEKVFQYPSFEDCKKVLLERIERKKELRKFAIEILGKKINQEDEDEIEKEIIQEMEGKIDREIQKIKEQIIKNKIKSMERTGKNNFETAYKYK